MRRPDLSAPTVTSGLLSALAGVTTTAIAILITATPATATPTDQSPPSTEQTTTAPSTYPNDPYYPYYASHPTVDVGGPTDVPTGRHHRTDEQGQG